MSYIESYQCDVCGDKKGEGGDWWLAMCRDADGSVDDAAACGAGFALRDEVG
jgi:hypothetical protein